MTGFWRTALKFGAFGLVMVLLTAALFTIFGQYRTGSTSGYSAHFHDASGLEQGDSVRVAGIRVGTVDEVAALICWLASEECSFSTGATYDISGGRAVY